MRFDRFGPVDTTERAEQRLTELLRQKTPEERLQMVFDRMKFMREFRKSTEHLRKRGSS